MQKHCVTTALKSELTEKNTIKIVHINEVPPFSSEFLLRPLQLCSLLNTFTSLLSPHPIFKTVSQVKLFERVFWGYNNVV